MTDLTCTAHYTYYAVVTIKGGSRGCRILSRLVIAGYRPGPGIQNMKFESHNMREIYKHLWANYRNTL